MTKKLICLLLCLLMVLPVLASCKKKDSIGEITNEASRYTTTLNLWMITEEGTDAAQVAAVNAAINKLTKAKYKTQINLKYLTAAEYYTKVEEAFKAHEAFLEENGGKVVPRKTNETYVNEFGIPELKYPTAPDFEVDILFLGSHQKFVEYIEKGWLSDLTNDMGESALKLSYYMNPTMLKAASYGGKVYAVPNNHTVGEYTYLLVDKQLASEYGDLSKSSIYDSDFENFLSYVKRTYGSGADPVYPIYSADGKVDVNDTHYWSYRLDGSYEQLPDTFSIFGANTHNADRTTKLENKNLLSDSTYMRRLAAKTLYEKTDGYITTDAEAKAAVRLVRGGYGLRDGFDTEKYDVLVVENPTLTDEEVFSSMFAVGSHTTNLQRSLEIITYLNTDAGVRNLFQYGIENVNYSLETTKVGEKEYTYAQALPENAYRMDINKTGNRFIGYPNSADSVLYAEEGQKQNLDLTVYPTFGLYFSKNYTPDLKSMTLVAAVSEKVGAYLSSRTSAGEILSVYAMASARSQDPAAMAEYLLLLTGPVTYQWENAAQTVGAADLTAAMTSLHKETVDAAAGALQSPYALYTLFCALEGIKGATEATN